MRASFRLLCAWRLFAGCGAAAAGGAGGTTGATPDGGAASPAPPGGGECIAMLPPGGGHAEFLRDGQARSSERQLRAGALGRLRTTCAVGATFVPAWRD